MRIQIFYISFQGKSIGNIQNYEALEEVYCLTTQIEGVASILRSLEHQSAIFFC
jgi:hypothetical protein